MNGIFNMDSIFPYFVTFFVGAIAGVFLLYKVLEYNERQKDKKMMKKHERGTEAEDMDC